MSAAAARRIAPGLLLWLVAYLATMAGLAAALVYVRRQTVAQLSSPKAMADWQAWKAETERQAERPGASGRRPVRSDEPPALVLLRDHFAPIMAMSLTVATFLFGFLAMILRGAVRGSK
ncbi:MAG TPA: hypothetical protein VMV10_29955 [Pirellulales bacterium]|nr:hypothetical protein [Pirellulales bacterium]